MGDFRKWHLHFRWPVFRFPAPVSSRSADFYWTCHCTRSTWIAPEAARALVWRSVLPLPLPPSLLALLLLLASLSALHVRSPPEKCPSPDCWSRPWPGAWACAEAGPGPWPGSRWRRCGAGAPPLPPPWRRRSRAAGRWRCSGRTCPKDARTDAPWRATGRPNIWSGIQQKYSNNFWFQIWNIYWTYSGHNVEPMERSDEATVAYGGRPLEHGPAHSRYGAVQTRPLVKVHTGEVQFPEVSGIVHVIQQSVHIVTEAQSYTKKSYNSILCFYFCNNY